MILSYARASQELVYMIWAGSFGLSAYDAAPAPPRAPALPSPCLARYDRLPPPPGSALGLPPSPVSRCPADLCGVAPDGAAGLACPWCLQPGDHLEATLASFDGSLCPPLSPGSPRPVAAAGAAAASGAAAVPAEDAHDEVAAEVDELWLLCLQCDEPRAPDASMPPQGVPRTPPWLAAPSQQGLQYAKKLHCSAQ